MTDSDLVADGASLADVVAAVEAAGTQVVPVDEATALVWADPQNPQAFPALLHDDLDWVQLPYAGIGPFLDMLDDPSAFRARMTVPFPPWGAPSPAMRQYARASCSGTAWRGCARAGSSAAW